MIKIIEKSIKARPVQSREENEIFLAEDVPSLEEIKKDYIKAVNILSKLHTVEDAREASKKYHTEIDIIYNDYMFDIDCNDKACDSFDSEDIEGFILEVCGCLEYIYYFTDDGKAMFNVMSANHGTGDDETIIYETTYNRLERDYNNFIQRK